MRSKKTYFERIALSSASTRKNTRLGIEGFEEFHGDKIENIIRKLKKKKESETFDYLQRWINHMSKNKLNPTSVKSYFGHLKQFFWYMGIKISREDVKMELIFETKEKEEYYPIQLEEIQKLFDYMPYWKRAMYIAKLSSGMRQNEVCNIRKKDLDLTHERIMVKIPAKFTKTKQARTTFISYEAQQMILPRITELNKDDKVWTSVTTGVEEVNFRNYVDKVGLGVLRYETTNRRKVNTHSLRAYFITKISRYDPNLAKSLAGQKGYLDQYDRLTNEEKLEIYLKVEPELIVDSTARDKIEMEKKDKEISELKKSKLEIEKLQRKQEETSVRLAEINDKIFSDFDKQKKPITDSDMELVANVIRSRMELDPEFSESFKKMVTENTKVPIETKKRIGAI